MHNTIDFLKLDGGKLGAVNFNNMLPVTTKNITKINFERILNSSDRAYYKLLQEQIYWLNRNRNQLYKKSFQLYQKQIANRLPNSIMQRCCNFKLLEEKCTEYNQNKMNITSLFNEYKNFCKDNNIKPETRENFKIKLKGEGYVIDESDKKKGVKVGIISSLPKTTLPFD